MDPVPADPEQKFKTPEAAEYLGGVAPRTLEAWRVYGRGPPYLKVGDLVVYRRRDLDAWLETCERNCTRDLSVGIAPGEERTRLDAWEKKHNPDQAA